jgi:subtilisin family serine protease
MQKLVRWGVLLLAAGVIASCGGGSDDTAKPAADPIIQALSTSKPDSSAHVSIESIPGHAKAPPGLLAKFAAGQPTNLFVVFDDDDIQAEARAMQVQRRLSDSHPTIVAHKSQRYSEVKGKILSTVGSSEVTELKHYSHLPMMFARVRGRGAIEKLLADPSVIAVYEDGIVRRAMLAQSLPLVGQPQALATGNLGGGSTVAVLDLRVDYSSSAFGSCTSPGVPASCRVLVAQDVAGLSNDGLGYQDGHGTNVAATVLAVAPDSKLISLNVFNGETAKDSAVIDAINWCIAHASTYNIVAINLSLGGSSSTVQTTASSYFPAFANARAAGILPIAGAGNNSYTNALILPAAVAGAVSVGAVYDAAYGYKSWTSCADQTTAADQVACFSNSASFLTLLAPGCEDDAGLPSTYFCGTSQATPHVAGAVAVLRSTFPTESLDQTVGRLVNGIQVLDAKSGLTKPRLSLPLALGLPLCTFTTLPTSISARAAGTDSSIISVSAGNGCSWTATSNVSWIRILSGNIGTGSGNAEYFISPNYDSAARTGSITIAGKTIPVSQPGGAASPSDSSDVWLLGPDTYQVTSPTSVILTAGKIFNASTRTTGTLRLELWVAHSPFVLRGLGWRIATWQLAGATNGTLRPQRSFVRVTSPSLPLMNLPPPGKYYAYMVLTEHWSSAEICPTSDQFCLDSFVDFPDQFFVPDVSAPTIPTALVASANSDTQVSLQWHASADNVGVSAYKVYNNGVAIGKVAANEMLVNGLTPATTYQFTVSACDAAENCSTQSPAVSAKTSIARLPADCLFDWAEQTYPDIFSPPRQVSATLDPFYYRYYASTNTYLATSSADADVWVLGPLFGSSVRDVGPAAPLLAQAGCANP